MVDPEIEAMSSVASALANLDKEAQERVLRWSTARFGIALGTLDRNHRAANGARTSIDGRDDYDAEEGSAEPRAFEHFAELYDATRPATKEAKLLVAAYWRQKIEGQASFQAHELNRDLKDLGHQIDHISEGLAASIKKVPALILQLRKSGTSQQARKTYKLSNEGVKTVEQIIASNR